MEKQEKKPYKMSLGFKIIGGLLLAFLIFLLVTKVVVTLQENGKTPSSKALSVAKQAIQVADDYLDGKITGNKAKAEFDGFNESMKYVDDLSRTDKNRQEDYNIQHGIFILSTSISTDDYKKTSESYDHVMESRNNLAKDAGLKNRK